MSFPAFSLQFFASTLLSAALSLQTSFLRLFCLFISIFAMSFSLYFLCHVFFILLFSVSFLFYIFLCRFFSYFLFYVFFLFFPSSFLSSYRFSLTLFSSFFYSFLSLCPQLSMPLSAILTDAQTVQMCFFFLTDGQSFDRGSLLLTSSADLIYLLAYSIPMGAFKTGRHHQRD